VSEDRTKRSHRRWWLWGGAVVGLALLAFVLWRIDYQRFADVVAHSRVEYLVLVPAVIALEQLVRAWKWRQILHPLRAVGTLRLFGAIMAGYLGNLLIPFGVSPLLRSWLVARLERLKMSAVLATVAIDRLIDGVVFTVLVAVVLTLAVFPDPTGNLRLGLVVGAVGSLLLVTALLWLLAQYKRGMADAASLLHRLILRLPGSLAERSQALMASFAEGVIWPAARWRRLAVVLSSIMIKLIAATHFLFAGLAFGVLLRPLDYLFLIVFLGFIVILTHFARLAGGFIVGAIFALGLFGVTEEQALAMVLVVQTSSIISVAAIGAFALWREGVAIGDLQVGSRGSNDDR
jgi:glycosyltransferase 2 family protein